MRITAASLASLLCRAHAEHTVVAAPTCCMCAIVYVCVSIPCHTTDSGAPGITACELYGKFWEQYGRSMKLGTIEDQTNRNRLTKLLRFHTSKSLDKLTSLEEYVSRMKEGQKDIYYLAGERPDMHTLTHTAHTHTHHTWQVSWRTTARAG